jgi:hypothetical protein
MPAWRALFGGFENDGVNVQPKARPNPGQNCLTLKTNSHEPE